MSIDTASMEIPTAQFAQIEHCLPLRQGSVGLSNLPVPNAGIGVRGTFAGKEVALGNTTLTNDVGVSYNHDATGVDTA